MSAQFTVELLVVIEADSFTEAEALGERVARAARISACILNVIVADVRSAAEDGGHE